MPHGPGLHWQQVIYFMSSRMYSCSRSAHAPVTTEYVLLLCPETNIRTSIMPCRAFGNLPGLARARLLDGLAMNMSYVCKSITSLLTSESQLDDYEHMASAHRSALKAYLFFLHWMAAQAKLCNQQQDALAASSGVPATVSLGICKSNSHGLFCLASAAIGKGAGPQGQPIQLCPYVYQRTELQQDHQSTWLLDLPRAADSERLHGG